VRQKSPAAYRRRNRQSVDAASHENTVGIVFSQPALDDLVAAIVRAKGSPIRGCLAKTVAGTNENLRGAQLVGQAKKIGGQTPIMLFGPYQCGSDEDRAHLIARVFKLHLTPQRGKHEDENHDHESDYREWDDEAVLSHGVR
jgi:hypothetical protein